MKKYFFSFRAPSRLAFDNWKIHQNEKGTICSVDLENGKMIIYDSKVEYGTVKVHYGLGFDFHIECEHFEHGLNVAL